MPEQSTTLVLYDGDCPICCRKISFLKKRDSKQHLRFQSIRAEGFNASTTGIVFRDLEKQIHAVLPDGSVISRMDVIRTVYREIGLGWLVEPTRWPVLRIVFDHLYGFTARNRLAISQILFKKNEKR